MQWNSITKANTYSQTSALLHAISHNVNIFHMTIWGKNLKIVCLYHQSLEKQATKFVLTMSSNADKSTASQVDYWHRAVLSKSILPSQISKSRNHQGTERKIRNSTYLPLQSPLELLAYWGTQQIICARWPLVNLSQKLMRLPNKYHKQKIWRKTTILTNQA